MMSKQQQGFKPNNGSDPAMPVQGILDQGSEQHLHGQLFHGLTKREHFAAMAMQGFISAGVNGMPDSDSIASLSMAYADALLAALEESE